LGVGATAVAKGGSKKLTPPDIVRDQLSGDPPLYNGTSYLFDTAASSCRTFQFPVGILPRSGVTPWTPTSPLDIQRQYAACARVRSRCNPPSGRRRRTSIISSLDRSRCLMIILTVIRFACIYIGPADDYIHPSINSC
ncbi:hypothetical protein EE612_041621, partial [Oryza sativa]